MKIAILDDYQQVALKMADWSVMPEDAEVVAFADHIADPRRLAERLKSSEIIVAMRERTPFDGALMRQLPNLRLLVTTGMGNAAIDMHAAADLGILVCGTQGGGPATAELAWGLIISLARHIPEELDAVRRGVWQTSMGTELHGKTLGLLGLGNLGSHMARIGSAFGMSIAAWSENLTEERAKQMGCVRVSRDELFSRSDVVSIHVRLSDRTRGLVGEHELSLMKPTAYLINTSRGPIVDFAALVRVLKEHLIAGAGIDVYDEEPLPADNPLISLDNVVLTPHVGYVTKETYRVFYGHAVEDILAYRAAQPLRVLNPEVLGKRRRSL